MKHTFTKHLYQVRFDFDDVCRWKLMDSATLAGENDPEWLYVGPREVTVEVPDEFADMRVHQVAALRAQEKQIRADFAKSITDIQARIQSLLALEMS